MLLNCMNICNSHELFFNQRNFFLIIIKLENAEQNALRQEYLEYNMVGRIATPSIFPHFLNHIIKS